MSACKMHCGPAHVDQLLGHPCLFRRPQASGLRLKQYHLAAQRPLRSPLRVRAISHDNRNSSRGRDQPVGERDYRHAPQPRSWPVAPETTERLSFGQRILRFLKQVGLAALFLLFGFGRVLSARASVPTVPDPAPMVYTVNRHGETVSAEASISGSSEQHRCQDTGIQLAAATETETATRPGIKVDTSKSQVPDPSTIPAKGSKALPATIWRVDRLREMTYTQFWQLIQERQIERVQYSGDKRSVMVTTRATAPGGARSQKVGLPFDPDLFDHMVEHGVIIEAVHVSPIRNVISGFLKLIFPLTAASLLIRIAFNMGVNPEPDKLFGGISLDQITGKDVSITFNDIAGIDQVKQEIIELVEFLKNPQRFLDLGARSPAGVLLVGPPGTGKTLLAKAIAGEAGVPFYTAAGTEFSEMFVGIGASRVRDMFEKARKAAPCILFIDEFDGLGKQRSFGGMGNDESVHTINQLLTEMDGFEDNTGVVVMAATNRPAALDSALTRPGRFDRIIHLPLPNIDGRIGILEVHARDKKLEADVDFQKVARATAGFTGAELMNLMNTAAVEAVRQGRDRVTEADIFEALEKIHREKYGGGGAATQYEDDIVPPLMRRSIAVYEAGRVLLGYMTPHYDEISKVSVCPGGVASGYTYFIPQEEHLESSVVTRGYMEARLVVGMAGRCAEKLLMGEGNVTTAGAADVQHVNSIAREMIYRCGFSKRLGPVSLMDNEEVYINKEQSRAVANIGSELAAIATTEVEELVQGAEAKALYGLVLNYKPLQALVDRLINDSTLTGEQVGQTLEGASLRYFPDPFVDGFTWGQDGSLVYPGMAEQMDDDEDETAEDDSDQAAKKNNGDHSQSTAQQEQQSSEAHDADASVKEKASVGQDSGEEEPDDLGENDQEELDEEDYVDDFDPLLQWHPKNPYRVRMDLPDVLSEQLR